MDKVQKTNHFEDKSEMTREEEIQFKKQVKNETVSRKDELIDAAKRNAAIISEFIRGAEWADKNPKKGLWDAEKVCKWISERIGIDQKIETNSDGEPLADSYIAYCIARQDAADTMIKDLRKAMED